MQIGGLWGSRLECPWSCNVSLLYPTTNYTPAAVCYCVFGSLVWLRCGRGLGYTKRWTETLLQDRVGVDAEWCYVQCGVWCAWGVDEMMHGDVVDAMRILVHKMGAAAVANPNTMRPRASSAIKYVQEDILPYILPLCYAIQLNG